MSDQPNEDPATTDDVEAEPLNRAERRAAAKGKGSTKAQQQGKSGIKQAGSQPGGKSSPAGGPRLWANRRAG